MPPAPHSRTIGIKALICATVFFLAAACSDAERESAGAPADEKPWNLILISLDTCRADRLSCYGATRKTPNIDRLASESVQFQDCLAQSCVTAPSHLSLLTSHYVHRHRLVKNGLEVLPPYSLASTLQSSGWQTAAFTGHGSFQAKFGHGFGFDTFQSWIGPEQWPFTRNLAEVMPHALGWLDEKGADPFFLLVHGYDPHCPYWPPEPLRSEFAGWYEGQLNPERLCGPPQFLDLIRRGRIRGPELRYVNDLYDAEVRLADDAIGGFLDELERRGLLETSIVVFTSDHGEALGAKNRIGHGALTGEILSVPLLIRFPESLHTGILDDPVELVDLMPTLLTALGVEAPKGLQGRDLMSLIESGRAPWVGDRMRIAQANETVSLRFGQRWKLDFKLIDGRLKEPLLFDLDRDPSEERNLYAESNGRARFDDLSQRFLDWLARTLGEDQQLYGDANAELSAEDKALLEAIGYGD